LGLLQFWTERRAVGCTADLGYQHGADGSVSNGFIASLDFG